MKKLIFISLIFLSACGTKAINQEDKKDNKTNVQKDSWIYQTPWGKSALR